MAIRLAFVDSNRSYIEKLTAWINKFMPHQFSIEILTSPESFETWTKSGVKADLTAVSIDLFKDVQPLLPKEGILVLDDGSHQVIEADVPRISKYRPAEELMKDILSVCADRLPKMHIREGRALKITLISYLDGSDTVSPVAPYIAYLFNNRGRKVFYLSLEQNQVTDLYFCGNNNRGLNEMLYYAKSNKDNLSMRLETCTGTDTNTGIDFLKAPPGLLVSGDIEAGDIDKLLSAAGERNIYDEVVLVADMSMNDKFIHMLKKADRILFVSSNTAGSCLKFMKFLKGLKWQDFDPDLLFVKLRLVLIKLCVSCDFYEQFPNISKVYIQPNAIADSAASWLPPEADLSVLDNAINNIDMGEKKHE